MPAPRAAPGAAPCKNQPAGSSHGQPPARATSASPRARPRGGAACGRRGRQHLGPARSHFTASMHRTATLHPFIKRAHTAAPRAWHFTISSSLGQDHPGASPAPPCSEIQLCMAEQPDNWPAPDVCPSLGPRRNPPSDHLSASDAVNYAAPEARRILAFYIRPHPAPPAASRRQQPWPSAPAPCWLSSPAPSPRVRPRPGASFHSCGFIGRATTRGQWRVRRRRALPGQARDSPAIPPALVAGTSRVPRAPTPRAARARPTSGRGAPQAVLAWSRGPLARGRRARRPHARAHTGSRCTSHLPRRSRLRLNPAPQAAHVSSSRRAPASRPPPTPGRAPASRSPLGQWRAPACSPSM